MLTTILNKKSSRNMFEHFVNILRSINASCLESSVIFSDKLDTYDYLDTIDMIS